MQLHNTLHRFSEQGLLRTRAIIDERAGSYIATDNQLMINFASNDYFGLSDHFEVKKAFKLGVEKYGLGSGASNLISGYFKPHQQLEVAFAEFLQRDRALLFNSGYHANLGVISALCSNHNILADKLCHASIIDGILLSRSKYYRYPHQNLSSLKKLIEKHPKHFILTESVFSMQGHITDLKKISELSHSLIIDDAHGIGVLGDQGRGTVEHFGLTQKEVPCLITPLGKALGSIGAIVSGSHELIEHLLQFARTYCYTTALPPAISLGTLAALKVLKQENWRRAALQHNICFFIRAAKDRGLKLASLDETPIKSIIVHGNETVMRLQKKLFAKNIFVSAIRPPTVPLKSARLRISLHSHHTETQILQLLDELYCLLK